MKKLMIIFILVSVVVGLYSEENLLWCKKIIFNEPTKHIIQKGDYFSKLSKQYYGTSKYWRELALINRAPNKDLVFPGEEVIIPSLEAIKKLHRSRSLTKVNSIVDDQVEWIAKNHNVSTTPLASRLTEQGTTSENEQASANSEDLLERESASTASLENNSEVVSPAAIESETDVTGSSFFPILLTIAAIGLVVGLMAWYLARRKKQYEIDEFEPEGQEGDEFKLGDVEEEDEFVPSFGKRESEEVLVD